MAIKIYTPQINVSRKPAGSSSPNLNFGASEFLTTAAATADATGNALATYFINKKTKELELEVSTINNQVNDSLNTLHNSYLDPQGEKYLSPQTWEENFAAESKLLINNATLGIKNKLVAQSVRSNFATQTLTLNNSLTKESFKRTAKILESNLNEETTSLINTLSTSNNAADISKKIDALDVNITKKINGGFFKDGDSFETLYTEALGEVVSNRIMTATENMTTNEIATAFQTETFGDEVVDTLIGGLSQTEKNTLFADSKKRSLDNLDNIIKFEEKADDIFNKAIEGDIVEMMSEPDAAARKVKYDALLLLAAGDTSQIKIINDAYDPNYFYSERDTMDLQETIAAVYTDAYSFEDIYGDGDNETVDGRMGLRDNFTKESWLLIQDAHAATQDGVRGKILRDLKTEFQIDENPLTETDIEGALQSVANNAFAQVDLLLKDKSLNRQEIKEQVSANSKESKDLALYDLFKEQVADRFERILPNIIQVLGTTVEIRPNHFIKDTDNILKLLNASEKGQGTALQFNRIKNDLLFKYTTFGTIKYAEEIGNK
tara:strand:- start:4563 stop:6212 length:1650 start_codon:yes stop_codon:yes gene_type:complete